MKNIRPGGADSDPSDLFNFNGLLIFHANDGTVGSEPHTSNNTLLGTTLV